MRFIRVQQGFFIIETMVALACLMCVVGVIAAGHAYFSLQQHEALKRMRAVTIASNFIEKMIASGGQDNVFDRSHETDGMTLEYKLFSDAGQAYCLHELIMENLMKRLEVTVSWSTYFSQKTSATFVTFFEGNQKSRRL